MKIMDKKYKDKVFESFSAYQDGCATEEQELIWELANAIHKAHETWLRGDSLKARQILYAHDYTIND